MTKRPELLGPYRIVGVLGRGGMSVVYEARHETTGEVAAVKTVVVAESETLTALRREIRMLAKVRHPGIVRILDEGLDAGRPWYAMELLAGETLRTACSWAAALGPEQVASSTARLATDPQSPLGETRPFAREEGALHDPARGQAPAGPLPPAAGGRLAEALTLVRRLCAPLAFLHGEGFVHRDLKPENVMLLPGGRPVLMDFGIVSELGGERTRDSLAISAELAGTVAYMAPEQSRGVLVDARADLYALGCILYELLTGRPPFVGSSAGEVLVQHWSNAPDLPSLHRSGVPPALDALVASLLAKEPSDRTAHADIVADTLARLGAEGDAGSGAIRPRSYLYRARLAGRSDAVRDVAARLATLRTGGGGGIVLVSGESGSGKTRLLVEALALSSQAALATTTGACSLPEAGPVKPLGALAGLLQVAGDAALHDPAVRRRLGGRHALALSLYDPAFRELAGADAASETGRTERLDVLLAIQEAAAVAVRRAPLVLALDDLQWADELTTEALLFLFRQPRPEIAGLLVVAAHRTEDPSAAVEGLRALPAATTVRIGRLDRGDVGAIVSDMMAAIPPPGDLVAELAERSEGNPFFVAEYLRTAVAEGLLVRRPDGRWGLAADAGRTSAISLSALPLPGGIEELLVRRLSVLSDPARETLQMASVIGREVDGALLRALTEGDDRWEQLRELEVRELLEPVPPGSHRIRHERIREAAYRSIPAGRRDAWHRRAAEEIEARGTFANDPGRTADLARHWHQAGDVVRAKRHYRAAADMATARYAHDIAEPLLRTYLSLCDTHDRESLKVWCDLIQGVLAIRGRNQEAADESLRALAVARELGLRAEEALILKGLADAYRFLGRREEGEQRAREGVAIAVEAGAALTEVRCLQTVTIFAYEAGRLQETAPMQERCLELSTRLGDPSGQIIALTNLGILNKDMGRLEVGRDYLRRALELARLRGMPRLEALANAGLSILAAIDGDLVECERLLRQGIVAGRKVGDAYMEAIASQNLALLLSSKGQPEEATLLYADALRLHHARDDRTAEATTRVRLAGCHLALGKLDDARREIERTIEDAASVNAPHIVLAAQIVKAELAVAEGDLAEARIRATLARGLLDGGVAERWDVGMEVCNLGHVAIALGEDPRPLLAIADASTSKKSSLRLPAYQEARGRLAAAIAKMDASDPAQS